jgi:hypothetical protein
MIDLWLVVSNSLWIAGLTLLLATLSWASWAAHVENARMHAVLARPAVRRAWGLWLALFGAGMAVTGRAWWESMLWAGLTVGVLAYAFGFHVVDDVDTKGKVF